MTPKRYRKKPVVIEAMQLIDDLRNHQEVAAWIGVAAAIPFAEPCLYIDTLEGRMRADIGDYVIKGVQGEFYPCKSDVFQATYEEAAELIAQPFTPPEAGKLFHPGLPTEKDCLYVSLGADGFRMVRDVYGKPRGVGQPDYQWDHETQAWRDSIEVIDGV